MGEVWELSNWWSLSVITCGVDNRNHNTMKQLYKEPTHTIVKWIHTIIHTETTNSYPRKPNRKQTFDGAFYQAHDSCRFKHLPT